MMWFPVSLLIALVLPPPPCPPKPDIRSVDPDLLRPNMTADEPAAGRRVRQVHPNYQHTRAYHALYLPTDWQASAGHRYPVIVEYLGNGPWSSEAGDVSTGRPEDANLGYGMGAGKRYIWISMPLLTSDKGNDTEISTYWWGCPDVVATKRCGASYNITPTLDYTKRTVRLIVEEYGGDPDAIVLTGWSRGAIAVGAVGLYDDEIAALWRAFVPYSWLDGIPTRSFKPGFPASDRASALRRMQRLRGRPEFVVMEKCLGTGAEKAFLEGTGVPGNYTFADTGFENHNNAWVLRPSAARDRLRAWLDDVLRSPTGF